MRNRAAGLILFVAVVAVLPTTAASARGFSYGVAAAEVTPSSALLWARPLKAGKLQLELALDSHFRRLRLSKTLFATKANDLTAQTRVAGLQPDRRYYYFFHQGRQRSLLGT